jgi:hypothetical protein
LKDFLRTKGQWPFASYLYAWRPVSNFQVAGLQEACPYYEMKWLVICGDKAQVVELEVYLQGCCFEPVG